MRAYLDTSVVVSIMVNDSLTARAKRFLRFEKPNVFVSDFVAAEFAAVAARNVRMKIRTPLEVNMILKKFDDWRRRTIQSVELCPQDVRQAEAFLRRLDLTLLAPDALHLAIVHRLGLTLVTFDTKMAASAQTVGIPVASA